MTQQVLRSVKFSRENNFDAIRLFAALQVAIGHLASHLRFVPPSFMEFLSYFPGIPIFFVVSGYLISASYERAPSLRAYFTNRFLRIYPALWVCLIFSTVGFLLAGFRAPMLEFTIWFVSQVSIAQFYNPEFLRSYGVGVLNGSLWSIPVEMQFYLILPLLVCIFGSGKRILPWVLMLLISMLMMILCRNFYPEQIDKYSKLMYVSLLPYMYYFAVGMILRKLNIRFKLFEAKFVFFLMLYGIIVWLVSVFDVDHVSGNALNPIQVMALGALVISAAFTGRSLSGKFLRGNDISYGVYIYHMPIANALLFLEVSGGAGFAVGILTTCLMATVSWFFVEQPSLRLKKYSN